MKKGMFVFVAVLCLVFAGVATAISGDQGKRLAGPFCIDKSNGVVHSASASKSCSADQIRKTGLAVPAGPAGPKGVAGTNGINGATGATGAAGPAGPSGATGATGATGAKGATGDVGPVGPAGAVGPKGDDYLAGAGWVTATYDVGDTNGGAIATVACPHVTDVAISGGVDVDDYTKVVPIGRSRPGRMDWSINKPYPNRLDGWIIQFASQNGSSPLKVTVYAYCVPGLPGGVTNTYTESVDG